VVIINYFSVSPKKLFHILPVYRKQKKNKSTSKKKWSAIRSKEGLCYIYATTPIFCTHVRSASQSVAQLSSSALVT